MGWQDLADAALRRCIGTLKTEGVYTATTGECFSVAGVLSRPSQRVEGGTGAPVISNQPTYGIRLADFPRDPEEGDLLELRYGGRYRVASVEEDGEGGASLVLQRA